ncbi:MAG TPA: hypothetical protein VKA02_07765 [Candidatus Acidoferrum sp.]|nr:hypothetical protein [Candidatus Acidoferrum sp.]
MDESPESRQDRPVNLRSGLVLVCCTVVFIVLASGAYFGPQTISYCRLRSTVFRPPDSSPRGWSSAPRPLDDAIASTAKGSVLSYYGYRFEVPWDDIDKEWDEGRTVRIRFKTGQVIRFSNPEYFQDNPVNSHVAQDDADYFTQAFGTGIRESKYDQFRAIVSTTPSQWSPFRSHKEFARVRILLGIKGLWFEHNPAAPDIFSFETNDYRGFELSGLSHDWQNVTVNLFDKTDRRFQISVLGDVRSGARVTQPEINRIIRSFGPIRPTQPKP